MWCFVSVVTRALCGDDNDAARSDSSLTRARVADGHCSAIISHRTFMLYDRGGSHTTYADSHIVDANTGASLLRTVINRSAIDTSGALVWRSNNHTLAASSGPGNNGRVLSNVKFADYICCFRYGICEIHNTDGYRVLRFDGEPAPAMEPDRKASDGGVVRRLWLTREKLQKVK